MNFDLRLIVNVYVDQINRKMKHFKNNIPEEDWARNVLKAMLRNLLKDDVRKLKLPELR